MRSIDVKKLFNRRTAGKLIIVLASIILIYLLISIYCSRHFSFNTVINGVNLSLRSYEDAEAIIKSYIENYELQLVERDGKTEKIRGQDIGMKYNERNSIYKIYSMQNSFKWVSSLLNGRRYYVEDLFVYNEEELENRIRELNCLNREIIEPQNVGFKYSNGSYEVVKEVYGNRINEDRLIEAIKTSILMGKRVFDLNANNCYENPRYTVGSEKVPKVINTLNRYVSTKITYIFGSEREVLDGEIINKWLRVDDDLEVVIDKGAVFEYVRGLGRKYDTVGIARPFKTSLGKVVEVKGGLYGWKIDRIGETKALIKDIEMGEVLEREPLYSQRALSRGENEIGNTYVEINITRQHLWFYKEGRLVAQGPVVTGNPNRGNHTKTGVYMLNYKERDATLVGENYEAKVNYWMPFFGNIGLHDATWRYSFGGEIYKRNGSHGCVNAPLYLAKRVYENIDEGTPIICYEE